MKLKKIKLKVKLAKMFNEKKMILGKLYDRYLKETLNIFHS